MRRMRSRTRSAMHRTRQRQERSQAALHRRGDRHQAQARAAQRTPQQAAEIAAVLASLPRVPREEIEACKTAAGGYSFTRGQLAAWGVDWPPPPGWLQALLREDDNSST